MTQREKNLAITVALLIVGYGAWLGWDWWQQAIASRQRDLTSAELALADSQLRESQARAALRQIENYRNRSLPSDPATAQSQYRDWLVKQFAESGLAVTNLNRITAPTRRANAYTTMTFKAAAEGELRSVAKFLYAFYHNRATHKITQLKLTPTDPPTRLRVDADIEAIVVDGTSRQSDLPRGDSQRLHQGSVENYLASITGRNLFVEYTPPPPPKPPVVKQVVKQKKPVKPAPFDDSAQARFTAAVGSGTSMQAWVLVLTTGESLRLSAGDELKVGLLDARVIEIGARKLIYEADDKQIEVPLGSFLRQGKRVADTSAS